MLALFRQILRVLLEVVKLKQIMCIVFIYLELELGFLVSFVKDGFDVLKELL